MKMKKLLMTAVAAGLLMILGGCSLAPEKYTAEDFENVKITLNKPTVSEIEKAYSRLPARGMVMVNTPFIYLSGVLFKLEGAGFIGMTVDVSANNASIIAYKGKEGDCYETGRSATPKLNFAVAALDDADHLLYKSTRICEKTAIIYSTSLYRNFAGVTGQDPALAAKNEKAPFLCTTAEDKAAELSKGVTGKAEKPEQGIFYKGPFKLLITKDGTVIRRGKGLMVSKKTAEGLLKDNCVKVAIKQEKKSPLKFTPLNYADKYKTMGKDFLVSNMQIGSFEGTF